MTRSKADGLDVKEALIDACAALLEDVPPEDVSLREVARRAHVSHAAPYHHFSSKAGLLAEVARRGFTELSASMTEAQLAAPGDARAQFLALGIGYFLFARRRPAMYQLMMEREAMLEPCPPDLENAGEVAFRQLVDTVAMARAASGLPAEGTLDDAFLAWSVVHGASSLVGNQKLGPETDRATEVALVRRMLERLGELYRDDVVPNVVAKGAS